MKQRENEYKFSQYTETDDKYMKSFSQAKLVFLVDPTKKNYNWFLLPFIFTSSIPDYYL